MTSIPDNATPLTRQRKSSTVTLLTPTTDPNPEYRIFMDTPEGSEPLRVGRINPKIKRDRLMKWVPTDFGDDVPWPEPGHTLILQILSSTGLWESYPFMPAPQLMTA